MARRQEELEELRQKFMEKRQAIADLYYTVFSTANGQAVLEHMKERAFFKKSLFWEQGTANAAVRSYREGQRSFMLETEEMVNMGKVGIRPPAQVTAISNTTRNNDEQP